MSDNTIGSRVKSAWNAFFNRDPTESWKELGMGYSYRPDRSRGVNRIDKSIVTAVYNRIAIDVAALDVKHVRLDENERYVETIDSKMNQCFSTEANIDQTGRELIQDIAMSLLDEGVVAVVPVDTTTNPTKFGNYDILTMRTAKILEWYPSHIKVRIYNDKTAQREEIILPKRSVAIIENPMYAVMNEQNSIAKRLIEKLNLLDIVDNQSSSGKLDLIIQLPYTTKSEQRRKQATTRVKDVERQLKGSKYGIAYVDATEKITQLNRPVENNLLSQVEYLTKLLFSQLGITQEIMDGTANSTTMTNYYNRTIEPIISAIVDNMKRKFLTKTARSQRQSILFFREALSLVSVDSLAEIADKFTRNEILSSNEVRQAIGIKPSEDPKADELRNKNLSEPSEQAKQLVEEEIQNGE